MHSSGDFLLFLFFSLVAELWFFGAAAAQQDWLRAWEVAGKVKAQGRGRWW
jgi:hypothetical protein